MSYRKTACDVVSAGQIGKAHGLRWGEICLKAPYHRARIAALLHDWNSQVCACVSSRAGLRAKWKHLACLPEAVEVIGPRLHHLAARRQMLGMVVRRLHCVAFRVGQLPLDHV